MEAQRLMEAATMTKKNFINEMVRDVTTCLLRLSFDSCPRECFAATRKGYRRGERNHANRQIESDLQEARAMMDWREKCSAKPRSKNSKSRRLAASRREGEKVGEEARRSAAIVEGQIKIRNYVYDPNVRPNGEPRNPAAVAMCQSHVKIADEAHL